MLSEWNFNETGYQIIEESINNTLNHYMKAVGTVDMYLPTKYLNTRTTVDFKSTGEYYDIVNEKLPTLTLSTRRKYKDNFYVNDNTASFKIDANKLSISVESLINDADSYNWAFGESTQVYTAKDTTYTYDEPGEYNITHTVIKNGITYQTIFLLEVNYILSDTYQIYSDSSFSTYINKLYVGCLATDDSAIEYIYDWGDGIISTVNTPAFGHNYKLPGEYTIKLTLVYENGLTVESELETPISVSKYNGYYLDIFPNITEKSLRFNLVADNNISDSLTTQNIYSLGNDWAGEEWKSIRYSCYNTTSEVIHSVDVKVNNIWETASIYREQLSEAYTTDPGYIFLTSTEGISIDNIFVESIIVNE